MNPRRSLADLLTRPGTLPALFALFFVLRATMLLFSVEPYADAEWYMNRARELAAGAGYVEDGKPTAYWAPGWPLTLAAVFRVTGASVLAMQAFNLACSMVMAWLTYDLGRRIFSSEIAGRLALLLLAIYPNNIGYVASALTETYYTTLILGVLWIWIVWPTVTGLVVGAIVLGWATMVKAQSVLIAPLFFAVVLMRGSRTFRDVLKVSAHTVGSLAIVGIVLLPWTLRNHRMFGEWFFVCTEGGLTLLTGNNPSARGDYTEDDPLVKSVTQTRNVTNQVEVDRVATRKAVAWIRQHPEQFALLLPRKLFRLWAPDGEAEWAFQTGYARYDNYRRLFRAVRYANQAYYVLLILGFIAAGVQLLSTSWRRPDWWLLPYVLALSPTLLALVFSGQSRFHFPVMPLVIACSGWLLTRPAVQEVHSEVPARRNLSIRLAR